MRLLVHLTNYGEFRKLVMGTNLRSELNKVYYRGKVYTEEFTYTIRRTIRGCEYLRRRNK